MRDTSEAETCRMRYHDELRYWELVRHADVTDALRNPALWTVAYGPGPLHLSPEQHFPLVGVDPPEHTIERRLVSKAFLPSSVAALSPRIEALVAGGASAGHEFPVKNDSPPVSGRCRCRGR